MIKLEKLPALTGLVSAVAIVVTLGQFAVQTRRNTAATQVSAWLTSCIRSRPEVE